MLATVKPFDHRLHEQGVRDLSLPEEELNEVQGFGFGDNTGEALMQSVTMSTHAYVILKDDKVVGVYGIRECEDGSASMWMMCSLEATQPVRHFYTECKRIVDQAVVTYGIVHNYVWEGHHRSIRWLKHLGFYVNPCTVTFADGKRFHPIYLAK